MDRIEAMQAFARLVEGGSFSQAARDVGVKQSTVSKWVARLEHQLGVPLVHRSTRHIAITDEGRRFYSRCLELLAIWEAARGELGAPAAPLEGRLRVGAPVVLGRLFVTPLLSAFVRKHPRIDLDVRYDDRYLDLVEQGLDVSIRVGTPAESSLRRHVLGQTRRCLVASPDYLKARGEPTEAGDLRHHACLRHTGVAQHHWPMTDSHGSSRVALGPGPVANNSEVLLTMAQDGVGIAMLAHWLVEESLQRGSLVEILTDYSLPSAPIHALHPPHRVTPPRVRAFVEFLKTAAQADPRLSASAAQSLHKG